MSWTVFKICFGASTKDRPTKLSDACMDLLLAMKRKLLALKGLLTDEELAPYTQHVNNFQTQHTTGQELIESAVEVDKKSEYKRVATFFGDLHDQYAPVYDKMNQLFVDGVGELDLSNDHARIELDKYIEEQIDWTSTSSSTKRKALQLMRARYKLDPDDGLTGTWDIKSLERLHRVLKNLPAGHTAGNARLMRVDLQTEVEVQEAAYEPREDLITLELPRKDGDFGRERFKQPKHATVKVKTKEADVFAHYTLHEVGHAVDFKLNVMEGNVDDDDHGGWKGSMTQESALVLVGAHAYGGQDSFFDAFPFLTQKSCVSMLVRAVRSGAAAASELVESFISESVEAETHAAEQLLRVKTTQAVLKLQKDCVDAGEWPESEALALQLQGFISEAQTAIDSKWFAGQPDRVGYVDAERAKVGVATLYGWLLDADNPRTVSKELLKQVFADADRGASTVKEWQKKARRHPALSVCENIGCSGETWLEGDDAVKLHRAGDYLISMAGGFWSAYKVTARTLGVSQYQFRAPSEWFAELYAMFHEGILPDTHPHYALIEGYNG